MESDFNLSHEIVYLFGTFCGHHFQEPENHKKFFDFVIIQKNSLTIHTYSNIRKDMETIIDSKIFIHTLTYIPLQVAGIVAESVSVVNVPVVVLIVIDSLLQSIEVIQLYFFRLSFYVTVHLVNSTCNKVGSYSVFT